jgi:hypothetical protein
MTLNTSRMIWLAAFTRSVSLNYVFDLPPILVHRLARSNSWFVWCIITVFLPVLLLLLLLFPPDHACFSSSFGRSCSFSVMDAMQAAILPFRKVVSWCGFESNGVRRPMEMEGSYALCHLALEVYAPPDASNFIPARSVSCDLSLVCPSSQTLCHPFTVVFLTLSVFSLC